MDTSATATETAVSVWRERVARPALCSSRLVFALCAAFAAPLCAMARTRPVAFHLYGPRAFGGDLYERDQPLHLASYLYGNMSQLQCWSDLAYGASARHATLAAEDGLMLIVDHTPVRRLELASAAALFWAEKPGVHPLRFRRDAITLSTADSLLDQQALQLIDASGKIYFFNIPADAGAGYGIFDQAAHDGAAAMIVGAAARSNGQVGLAWLRYLNDAGRSVVSDWRVSDFSGCEQPGFDSIDVHTGLSLDEIIQCFNRLGDAGELATQQGLTGWPAGAAQLAVCICLSATLNAGIDRTRVMSPRSVA